MSIDKVVNLIVNIISAEWISEAGLIASMATIVAILIPVAIILIDPKNDKFPLDRNIIFRKIFLYKSFIALIIPITISYLFPQIRLLSAIATIYLSALAMIVLVKMFKWLSSKETSSDTESFKQKIRIEYLNELDNEKEIIDAWSTILNSNYDRINQIGLLDAYLNDGEKIKNGDNNWNAEIYWNLLDKNFEKIKDSNIDTYKRLVKKTISYYTDCDVWKKNKDKDDLKERPPEALRQISIKLLRKAATSENYSIESFVYFNTINEYLKDKNEREVAAFFDSYSYDLFDCFLKNDVNYYDKWSGEFFKRLIITSNNYSQLIPSIVFDAYLRTILLEQVRKIDNPPNDLADRMSKITERLFTEIDPIIWFRVWTFLLWPYEKKKNADSDAKSRILNWCNRPRNYGVFGRVDSAVFSVSANSKKKKKQLIEEHFLRESEKQSDATYSLLVNINNFDSLNIRKYLDIICDLKKKKRNNPEINEKLEILELTLSQLLNYIQKGE